MKKVLISPSILSSDFSQVGADCVMLESNGADMLHCDVMDGVFVPNLTFGMKLVKDVKKLVKIPLDVHLMIVEPIKYVEQFALSGADIITFHLEATDKVGDTINAIKHSGAKVGISIKPNMSVRALIPYLDDVDLILIMSVEPGFGGQKFMPKALQKLADTKKLIGERNIILQVDGGVTENNVDEIIKAGADCIVAGSTVFKAVDKRAMMERLRGKV